MMYSFSMIRYKVKEYAQAHGVSTAYQLQKALNIAPSQAAHCFANLSIREKTLDKLCEYFGCQPGDLMAYEAAEGKAKASKTKR
jgi:DNA-binding Xre family transcriptional regulator